MIFACTLYIFKRNYTFTVITYYNIYVIILHYTKSFDYLRATPVSRTRDEIICKLIYYFTK